MDNFIWNGKEPVVVTKEQLPIIIGATGVKVKSKPIVQAVQVLENKFPIVLNRIIDNMGDIGLRAKKALEETNDLAEAIMHLTSEEE